MTGVNRNHNVSVRLNDDEYNTLLNLCSVLHQHKGTILRMNLLNDSGGFKSLHRRHKTPAHEWSRKDFKMLDSLNMLNHNLARTGNLVNQIARVANSTHSTNLSQHAVNDLFNLKKETDEAKLLVRKVANK